MPKLGLCTEKPPLCYLVCITMCVSVYLCLCLHECKTTQKKEADLVCNENVNCLSHVDLCCQSASQYSTAFQPLTKRPTINPDVNGTNHSTKPFTSFITDKSIALIVMFSPHVYSLFLHRFLSSIHLSELFFLYPFFQQFPSITFRGRFCNLY